MNLIGHSAGGHLALLAAGDIQRHLALLGRSELTLNIVGVAAIVDIKQYALGQNSCQAVTSDFMAGMPDEKVGDYYLANPNNLALTDQALTQQALRRDADARRRAAADMLPGNGPAPDQDERTRDRRSEQLAQASVACE